MPGMMIDFSRQVNVQWDSREIHRDLKNAIVQLSHHCLKLAAKWACEQLIGLPDDEDEAVIPLFSTNMTSKELYAKSLLELGEHAHAAAILSQPAVHVTVIAPPLPKLSQYGIYLRAYSMYLAGEQRKSQQQLELSDPLEQRDTKNPFLQQLRNELADFFDKQQLDAFGIYIYGMVLKESLPSKGRHDAYAVLVESIRMFPCNWSAWLDLADLNVESDSLLSEFGSHYMYHFYAAHVLLQKQQAHEASIQIYERLVQPSDDITLFAGSPYVASQLAVAHYHLREFHLSEHCFSQIHQRDPYRLEEMDIYSNILYVADNSMALSQLAHTAMRVDKYRPETCCIVGNYYSIKNLRTKAIQYFQRALKLNPKYTGAWTLMGHEYVELKNTPAAMEAYRKAADISPNDYRAWYGLGQAYEILGMPLYALYYYRKACVVRPYDARMWSAVAGCYLAVGKRREAILAYEKALADDVEGMATAQLASLYQQDGNSQKAAQCFQKHLELRYLATTAHPSANPSLGEILQSVVVQAPEARALLFLANHFMSVGVDETAALCASRLLEYPGPEKEEGKAVLREIRSRRGGSGESP
jgi:anaphase-promoting complex subunit 8